MIANKNVGKTMIKHISSDCKFKFNIQHAILIKNKIKKLNVNVKIMASEINSTVGILLSVFERITSF